jgi:hypothetical protein
MTEIQIIKKYFGVLPEYKGNKDLRGFMAEYKELTVEDKKELADLVEAEIENYEDGLGGDSLAD